MKIARLLLVVALLVTGSIVIRDLSPAQAQSLEPYTCADLNDPALDGTYGISVSYPTDTWTFAAGETITLITTFVGSGPVPPDAAMALWMNSAPVRQTSIPGEIQYTFAADTILPPGGSPVLNWEATGDVKDSEVYWQVSCSAAASAAAPGCDLNLTLTADAAVGSFVSDTRVLWGPDAHATTTIVLPAGKTAWVLGVDSTGGFYQFIWGCDILWAPVSALGPNFDAVWNGAPLPTTVVE